MNDMIEMTVDEFDVYLDSESVQDWSMGCDEVGTPIFDPAFVLAQLRLDAV